MENEENIWPGCEAEQTRKTRKIYYEKKSDYGQMYTQNFVS